MGQCTVVRREQDAKFADIRGPGGRMVTIRMPKSLNDFEILKKMGSSTHFDTYRARLVSRPNLQAVIKVVKKGHNRRFLRRVAKDKRMLKKVGEHPNLLFSNWVGPDKRGRIWKARSYCKGGPVLRVREHSDDTRIMEVYAAYIIRETLTALSHLHGKRFQHTGVKPSNILLTEAFDVKLTDPWVRVKVKHRRSNRGRARDMLEFTDPLWTPPEGFKGAVDSKGDIWALGYCGIVLATGRAPDKGKNMMKLIYDRVMLRSPGLQDTKEHTWSAEFKNFISRCLERDPKQRPTAAELLKHPFMNTARWRDFAGLSDDSSDDGAHPSARNSARSSRTGSRAGSVRLGAAFGRPGARRSRRGLAESAAKREFMRIVHDSSNETMISKSICSPLPSPARGPSKQPTGRGGRGSPSVGAGGVDEAAMGGPASRARGLPAASANGMVDSVVPDESVLTPRDDDPIEPFSVDGGGMDGLETPLDAQSDSKMIGNRRFSEDGSPNGQPGAPASSTAVVSGKGMFTSIADAENTVGSVADGGNTTSRRGSTVPLMLSSIRSANTALLQDDMNSRRGSTLSVGGLPVEAGALDEQGFLGRGSALRSELERTYAPIDVDTPTMRGLTMPQVSENGPTSSPSGSGVGGDDEAPLNQRPLPPPQARRKVPRKWKPRASLSGFVDDSASMDSKDSGNGSGLLGGDRVGAGPGDGENRISMRFDTPSGDDPGSGRRELPPPTTGSLGPLTPGTAIATTPTPATNNNANTGASLDGKRKPAKKRPTLAIPLSPKVEIDSGGQLKVDTMETPTDAGRVGNKCSKSNSVRPEQTRSRPEAIQAIADALRSPTTRSHTPKSEGNEGGRWSRRSSPRAGRNGKSKPGIRGNPGTRLQNPLAPREGLSRAELDECGWSPETIRRALGAVNLTRGVSYALVRRQADEQPEFVTKRFQINFNELNVIDKALAQPTPAGPGPNTDRKDGKDHKGAAGAGGASPFHPVQVGERFEKGDIVRIKRLGQGASGHVSLEMYVPWWTLVACKHLRVDNKKLRHQIDKELTTFIRTQRDHPDGIVNLVGGYYREGHIVIVLEYMNMGSLRDCVERHGPLPEDAIRVVAKQLLVGLDYLHKKGVLHRDIKPDNFLASTDGHVKIADFGLAQNAGKQGLCKTKLGTIMYLSPEVLSDDDAASYPADIWAFGLSMYFCAEGKHPMPGDFWELLEQITVNAPPELPARHSAEFRDFVSKCLVRDPRKRWTAAQLLEHKFVTSAPAVEALGKRFSELKARTAAEDAMGVARTLVRKMRRKPGVYEDQIIDLRELLGLEDADGAGLAPERPAPRSRKSSGDTGGADDDDATAHRSLSELASQLCVTPADMLSHLRMAWDHEDAMESDADNDISGTGGRVGGPGIDEGAIVPRNVNTWQGVDRPNPRARARPQEDKRRAPHVRKRKISEEKARLMSSARDSEPEKSEKSATELTEDGHLSSLDEAGCGGCGVIFRRKVRKINIASRMERRRRREVRRSTLLEVQAARARDRFRQKYLHNRAVGAGAAAQTRKKGVKKRRGKRGGGGAGGGAGGRK